MGDVDLRKGSITKSEKLSASEIAKKLYKPPKERCVILLKSILNFFKVVVPIIAICMAWRHASDRRENFNAVVHELSEIGLSMIVFHHD